MSDKLWGRRVAEGNESNAVSSLGMGTICSRFCFSSHCQLLFLIAPPLVSYPFKPLPVSLARMLSLSPPPPLFKSLTTSVFFS